MSRKGKIDPVLKVKAVEEVIADRSNTTAEAQKIGVSRNAVRDWIAIYKEEGPAGLLDQKCNKLYSKATKLRAVNDYLSGKGSLIEIASKYKLRSKTQLSRWVKMYNTQGSISSRGSGGGSYMKKARQTTLEERIEIVQYCLDHGRNYGEAAIRYKCSYQQVRNWVKKYDAMGKDGLEDRRGHRAGTEPGRTPEEKLRDRIAQLERQKKDLQMENDLLKKLRELKMKDRYL